LSGVAGGFVVVGRLDNWLIAVHYDFSNRKCTALQLASLGEHAAWKCFYFQEYHTIVARTDTATLAVDLATGTRHLYEVNSNPANRAIQACASAQGYLVAPPWMLITPPHFLEPRKGPVLHLDESTGWLTLEGVDLPWPPFAPLADGKPMLQRCAILKAQCRGH